MKILSITLIILATAILTTHKIYAQSNISVPNTDAPIVVELFTSQSCSSCPPADKILKTLVEHKNIIALGCHVSYWNHLHWKDTLSQDFCDMRQHGIQATRDQRKIYTPQMVVNGKYVFVGSNTSKLSFALNEATKNPLAIIDVKKEGNNLINVTLPAMSEGDYRIWGFGYKNEITTSIGRGENGGRTITYTNPVTTYHNLGAWNGMAETRKFESENDEIDGIVIFAQSEGYAEIIATGKLALY